MPLLFEFVPEGLSAVESVRCRLGVVGRERNLCQLPVVPLPLLLLPLLLLPLLVPLVFLAPVLLAPVLLAPVLVRSPVLLRLPGAPELVICWSRIGRRSSAF